VRRRRLYLPPERIAGGRAWITPEARHYLRDVLRLPAGAEIEIFDGAGAVYRATLTDGEALPLGERREVPPAGLPVWLAFALSKGAKPDLVIQKATELGAARLLPWQAARSVVRLEGERAVDRTGRWRRIAAEAARQCGRADVPEVAGPVALAEVLAAAPPAFARVVFEVSGEPLAPVQTEGILAIVGPEGGLVQEEIDACAQAGCRFASLGPRVLRAETAAIAAAALLQYLCGDLGDAACFLDPMPCEK
jgi:16S rRNA (uracil1498-N3)-methyltransferase